MCVRCVGLPPPCVVGRHPSPFVMGPAASYGKSPEDMYDEIVQLKKVCVLCHASLNMLAFTVSQLTLFPHFVMFLIRK